MIQNIHDYCLHSLPPSSSLSPSQRVAPYLGAQCLGLGRRAYRKVGHLETGAQRDECGAVHLRAVPHLRALMRRRGMCSSIR